MANCCWRACKLGGAVAGAGAGPTGDIPVAGDGVALEGIEAVKVVGRPWT